MIIERTVVPQKWSTEFLILLWSFIQENQVLLRILSLPTKKKNLHRKSLYFFFLSLISHIDKYLLATHQEWSTLSTKDIIITGGSVLTSL